MAIKPILFNTEMVQAILEWRKTQTRRIVKGLDGIHPYHAEPTQVANETQHEWDFFYGYSENGACFDAIKPIKAPYAVGDILWVRETWDNIPVSPGGHLQIGGRYYYKACYERRPTAWDGAWKPSIHMPKEAARIFLKVKDVRVERLQDMGEEDAIAEGFPALPAGTDSPLHRFSKLWDKTIQRDDLWQFGYHANPWVWVIEFERCNKPNDWGVKHE